MFDLFASSSNGVTRRSFARTAGIAGLGALALSQLGTLRALAQGKESVADVINIAATAEALAVTLTGAVIAGAKTYDGGQGLSPTMVAWVKGIQAEEQAHYQYLTQAGAKALTLTFTVPQDLAAITKDSKALLTFVVAAETLFIGAYTAAAAAFAAAGQPALAEIAYRVTGVECEHRVLARYAMGATPPNNVGFESAPFGSVGEAAAKLKGLGLLGAPNAAATLNYSDFAGKVDTAGVSGLTI